MKTKTTKEASRSKNTLYDLVYCYWSLLIKNKEKQDECNRRSKKTYQGS